MRTWKLKHWFLFFFNTEPLCIDDTNLEEKPWLFVKEKRAITLESNEEEKRRFVPSQNVSVWKLNKRYPRWNFPFFFLSDLRSLSIDKNEILLRFAKRVLRRCSEWIGCKSIGNVRCDRYEVLEFRQSRRYRIIHDLEREFEKWKLSYPRWSRSYAFRYNNCLFRYSKIDMNVRTINITLVRVSDFCEQHWKDHSWIFTTIDRFDTNTIFHDR